MVLDLRIGAIFFAVMDSPAYHSSRVCGDDASDPGGTYMQTNSHQGYFYWGWCTIHTNQLCYVRTTPGQVRKK